MSLEAMSSVSISGIDRAELLAALYNRARPVGLGFIHFTPDAMTVEEAAKILESAVPPNFDYLGGRVLKVNLSEEPMRVDLYDRDNGTGAAAEVITRLRRRST